MAQLIQSFLSERRSILKTVYALSDPVELEAEDLQGSVSSPMLYSLYTQTHHVRDLAHQL